MKDSRKLVIEGAQAFGAFFTGLGEGDDELRRIVLEELFAALRRPAHTNQVKEAEDGEDFRLPGSQGQERRTAIDDDTRGSQSTKQVD